MLSSKNSLEEKTDYDVTKLSNAAGSGSILLSPRMKLNFYQSQKQKAEAHLTNNSLECNNRQHNLIDIRR
jgi:hypothetical protein